jgi:hypothetical protein
LDRINEICEQPGRRGTNHGGRGKPWRIFVSAVGDGSKVENRDGSKVNWDNLHGKMAEDVGPYKIGRFFKNPEF